MPRIATTTFSDKKFPIDNNGLIDYYVADITSVSDSAKCYFETYPYKVQNLHWLIPNLKSLEFVENELLRIHNRYYYPFGSPMDGRTFGSERYVYGFGGHKKDVEVNGHGNWYTFGDFGFDDRLVRRLNLDPIRKAFNTGYSVFSCNPVIYVDPDGLTDFYYKGKYIGTDNNPNNLIAIVKNESVAKGIGSSMKKCGKYEIYGTEVKNGLNTSQFFVVNFDILEKSYEILLLAEKNPLNEFGVGMEKQGNRFVQIEDINKGPEKKLEFGAEASVEMSLPCDPEEQVSIHSHTFAEDIIAEKVVGANALEPSEDKDLKNLFPLSDMNIIVGKNKRPSGFIFEGSRVINERKVGINFFEQNKQSIFTIYEKEANKIIKDVKKRNE